MPDLINAFLRTELTAIPETIRTYIGNYNNTLTNGATWMFFTWTLIHAIFDYTVNKLLSKMQYKEYVRLRMIESLWNMGFYSSCFWFCSASLYKNNSDLFNQRRVLKDDFESNTDNFMVGFVFLITYVLHTAARSFIEHGLSPIAISHMWLSIFLFTTCMTRKLELAFAVMAIISFAHTGIELVRCVVSLLNITTKMTKFLSKLLLIIAVFLFLICYGFTLPLVVALPLLHELILTSSSWNLWILNFSLWMWLLAEVFNNIAYKLIKHVVVHKKTEEPKSCLGSTVECTLFFQRDDLAYHIRIVRSEIEERRKGLIGMRRPKGKNVIFQTLKSVAMLSMLENADKEGIKEKTPVEMIREGMVAIRRKLNQKRLAESSDSESESEPSEMLKTNEQNEDSYDDESETNDQEEDDAGIEADSEETDEETDNLTNKEKK